MVAIVVVFVVVVILLCGEQGAKGSMSEFMEANGSIENAKHSMSIFRIKSGIALLIQVQIFKVLCG